MILEQAKFIFKLYYKTYRNWYFKKLIVLLWKVYILDELTTEYYSCNLSI